MVVVSGTPWAKQALTPQIARRIRRMVDGRRVRVVSLAASRRPGDWSAYLIRRARFGDALGVARHRSTLEAAVAAARADMALGAPLAWCSHCSRPARFQRNGEAYCQRHERNRGGAA